MCVDDNIPDIEVLVNGVDPFLDELFDGAEVSADETGRGSGPPAEDSTKVISSPEGNYPQRTLLHLNFVLDHLLYHPHHCPISSAHYYPDLGFPFKLTITIFISMKRLALFCVERFPNKLLTFLLKNQKIEERNAIANLDSALSLGDCQSK